ncbi:MAG: cytidine deaminase [Lachnospiraceae bacterium]
MENNKVYVELIERAIKARTYSYSPYSHFMVGAALLTKSGKIYTGCNIESVSYTPTTCAERVAILKAVSEGERAFDAIAIVGGPVEGVRNTKTPIGPCGVCRQFIYEFGTDIEVIMANGVDDYQVKTISELFPFGFGPENLL